MILSGTTQYHFEKQNDDHDNYSDLVAVMTNQVCAGCC